MVKETVILVISTSQFQTATFSWSCGSELSHRDFRLTFVRNKGELAGPQPHPLQTVGRPSALATRIGCLVENSRQHSPNTTKARMDCVVCHAHTKNIRRIQPKCEKCNIVLCISICFKDYHTKAQFQIQGVQLKSGPLTKP